MNQEKTITICGQSVRMRYCAAAETGYEEIAGKSSTVFAPVVTAYDEDGKPKEILPPPATTGDYIKLGLAAIVAAYARDKQDAPVSADQLIYDATPDDIKTLITTVIELRATWYNIPGVVKPETDEPATNADDPKNA